MGTHVCLWANTLAYPEGGGHFWVYLNWALGLRAAGCDVTWLEGANPKAPLQRTERLIAMQKQRLAPHGLTDRLAICSETPDALPTDVAKLGLAVDDVADADLLLNLSYLSRGDTLRRFRRTAMIDIDPGILQIWMSAGQWTIEKHDVYFSIGETVGRPDAKFPSCGIEWQHTPPCVSLDGWPVAPPLAENAPFTTVSNWSVHEEWMIYGEDSYRNDKRSGFLPFIELPRMTKQPLTLALCQAADAQLNLTPDEAEEKRTLDSHGWRIVHANAVASTPESYQRFIQQSKGEFSCCKPSCVRLQNAWVSDRTLCYLASGRPAIVRHTGPSRFLPDAAGLFRFHDITEAAKYLDLVASDYPRQSALARALAEEHFDAKKVATRVLERAL